MSLDVTYGVPIVKFVFKDGRVVESFSLSALSKLENQGCVTRYGFRIKLADLKYLAQSAGGNYVRYNDNTEKFLQGEGDLLTPFSELQLIILRKTRESDPVYLRFICIDCTERLDDFSLSNVPFVEFECEEMKLSIESLTKDVEHLNHRISRTRDLISKKKRFIRGDDSQGRCATIDAHGTDYGETLNAALDTLLKEHLAYLEGCRRSTIEMLYRVQNEEGGDNGL